MSEVLKYKAIGGMAQRSRVGGADYVRLSDYDALQQRLTETERREAELLGTLVGVYQSCLLAATKEIMLTAHFIKSANDKDDLNPVEDSKTPIHICDGCGGQGWTANCDKCIPY